MPKSHVYASLMLSSLVPVPLVACERWATVVTIHSDSIATTRCPVSREVVEVFDAAGGTTSVQSDKPRTDGIVLWTPSSNLESGAQRRNTWDGLSS